MDNGWNFRNRFQCWNVQEKKCDIPWLTKRLAAKLVESNDGLGKFGARWFWLRWFWNWPPWLLPSPPKPPKLAIELPPPWLPPWLRPPWLELLPELLLLLLLRGNRWPWLPLFELLLRWLLFLWLLLKLPGFGKFEIKLVYIVKWLKLDFHILYVRQGKLK